MFQNFNHYLFRILKNKKNYILTMIFGKTELDI